MNTKPGWQVLRSSRTPDPWLRDWLLWCDWCVANGRPPLPAEPDHIAEFVAVMDGGGRLRRRRVTSILAKCDLFGEPVLLDVEGQPRRWQAALGDLGPLLAGIPRWGWPAGLNRRRDGFVLVAASLGFTRRQIRGLNQADVVHTGTGWQLDSRRVPEAAVPAECAGCAVADWLAVLSMTITAGRAEAQAFLTRGERNTGHRCQDATDQRWRKAAELVPAIDRHGWVAETDAISTRTVSEIIRTWATRVGGELPAGPEPAVAMPHRTEDGKPLDGIDDLLDDLDARVAEISDQVELLLQVAHRA